MMTYKQKLFAEFMLKRIGLESTDHIEKYLTQLEKVYGIWSEYTNIHGYTILDYSVSNCIQLLKDEIDLKKNRNNIIVKEQASSKLAATDLSNYVYCPVGFSINKSFVIANPTGEEFTENGTLLHEQLRLLKKHIPHNLREDEAHSSNVFQNELIKKIRNSEVIFIGHNDNKHYFNNEQENFIGQPDYIFKDEQGKYFVVEEKFHSLKSESHSSWEELPGQYKKTSSRFFGNHEIQLISYIRNINEFKIDYGYLIYWFYQTTELVRGSTTFGAFPQIHDINIKRIELNQANIEFYNRTVEDINTLRTNGRQRFDSNKIIINKCVGCVVNKYCTHKSGRLNTFDFPYKKEDVKLFFTEFPAELKK